MKIEISEIALKELTTIKKYIAVDSEYYAKLFISKLLNSIKKLSKFPQMGCIVPEINRKEIRELFYKHYRIIYKVKKEKIIILTIIHSSRDLNKYSKKDW